MIFESLSTLVHVTFTKYMCTVAIIVHRILTASRNYCAGKQPLLFQNSLEFPLLTPENEVYRYLSLPFWLFWGVYWNPGINYTPSYKGCPQGVTLKKQLGAAPKWRVCPPCSAWISDSESRPCTGSGFLPPHVPRFSPKECQGLGMRGEWNPPGFTWTCHQDAAGQHPWVPQYRYFG